MRPVYRSTCIEVRTRLLRRHISARLPQPMKNSTTDWKEVRRESRGGERKYKAEEKKNKDAGWGRTIGRMKKNYYWLSGYKKKPSQQGLHYSDCIVSLVNRFPGHDREAPVLDIRGLLNITSVLLFPNLLWHAVVVHVKFSSMDQINLF